MANIPKETHEIKEFKLLLDNRTVTLVDMPGFDDTDVPDMTIFSMTADWLRRSYIEGRKFSAIIYLQRISDNRVGGSAMRNIVMFRDLCGDHFLKDVLLVSTLWDSQPTQQQLQNEKQLTTTLKFWGIMINAGAEHARFSKYDPISSGRAAAQDIVRQCLRNVPIALKIQEQMVDEELDIKETTAGKQVNAELEKIAETYRKEMEKYKDDAAKERDAALKQIFELQEENAKNMRDKANEQLAILAKHEADQKNMANELDALRRELENKKLQPGPNQGSRPLGNGISRLYQAVIDNNIVEARQLLNNGSSPNATDEDGDPALSVAVENKKHDMVVLLLEHGASPTKRNKQGRSPLHIAAEEGYLNIMEELIASADTLEGRDRNGWTPLYTACYNGKRRVAEALLDGGAKIGSRAANGNTPLHAAARNGYKNLVEFLLDEGANVRAKNGAGRTAMMVAKREGNPNTAKLLRRHE